MNIVSKGKNGSELRFQSSPGVQKSAPPVVTEGAISLIGSVVKERCLSDRMEILEAVCETLENRWTPNALEARLSQMGLQTTSKILYAIDMYLVGKNHNFL